VFKHFPLTIHQDARPASIATLCVQEQNKDKFWAYHDMLFQNQRNLGAEDLKAYAKKVGVDVAKFDECMASKKYDAQVQADFDEGVRVGVNSTPSFFVNSQPLLGARPLEEFSEIIDEELALAKKK
jgi:protein-disulfide isomerase